MHVKFNIVIKIITQTYKYKMFRASNTKNVKPKPEQRIVSMAEFSSCLFKTVFQKDIIIKYK